MSFLPLSFQDGCLGYIPPRRSRAGRDLGSRIRDLVIQIGKLSLREVKALHDPSKAPLPLAPPHLQGSELGLELKSAHSLSTTLTHDGRGRGERRVEETRESLGAWACMSEMGVLPGRFRGE